MSFTVHRRFIVPLAVLSVAGIALAGCSTGGGGSSAAPGPGDAGTADGVVTIYGTIADTEATLLEKSWADWGKSQQHRHPVRKLEGVRSADLDPRPGRQRS